MSSKIIIIRGNSGSGKTTVAKQVRALIGDGLSDDTMLLQQDVLRRDILRERDQLNKRSVIELIEMLVDFGIRQKRTVILEGIFTAKKYGPMLNKLIRKFDESYVYYFDLPFEETLNRHASKPNSHEYGEKEMLEWWNDKDFLGTPGEKILHENLDVEGIVCKIMDDIGVAN